MMASHVYAVCREELVIFVVTDGVHITEGARVRWSQDRVGPVDWDAIESTVDAAFGEPAED